MTTIGEFIDLAQKTYNTVGAEAVAALVCKMNSSGSDASQTEPFTEAIAKRFLADIAWQVRERLYGLSDDHEYARTFAAARDFLRELMIKALAHGLALAPEDAELPLVITRELVRKHRRIRTAPISEK